MYSLFKKNIYFTRKHLDLPENMAPHSSTLAWKILWTEEPGRLQSMGSRRVRHDWTTSLSLFTFLHWRRKWQPTPVFLPGESQWRRSLGGLPSLGSHRVGHDWSDLAAVAAFRFEIIFQYCKSLWFIMNSSKIQEIFLHLCLPLVVLKFLVCLQVCVCIF